MDSENLGTLTMRASGAVIEKTFVETDTTAGDVKTFDATGYPLGVAKYSADDNQSVAIEVRGVVRVTAGAAVVVGAPITANNEGQAITATGGVDVIGIALSASTADGEVISVCLDVKGTTAAV